MYLDESTYWLVNFRWNAYKRDNESNCLAFGTYVNEAVPPIKIYKVGVIVKLGQVMLQ